MQDGSNQPVADENEQPLGYIAEEPRGFLAMFARQLFRTHRPFQALVMDIEGSPVLWVRVGTFARIVSNCNH